MIDSASQRVFDLTNQVAIPSSSGSACRCELYAICYVAAIFVILAGCDQSSLESQVSGHVKLDGNLIGPGTVVFAPVSGGKPATGSIESDGSYALKTSRESGLAAGKYQVAVSIREMPT